MINQTTAPLARGENRPAVPASRWKYTPIPLARQGGCMVFQRAKRVWFVSHKRKPGCEGFIHKQGQHSDELATSGGFPPFGAYGTTFPPLCGGTIKLRITFRSYICGSKVSTGCCPTACGGKVVAPATKGGRFSLARKGGCMVFQRAKQVWLVFPRAKPGSKGFSHQKDQHSADWLTAFATPYPPTADSPLCRGGEWASLRFPIVSCDTMLSTHSAP